MIEKVIKYDGSVEDFSPDKLNRWAKYACKVGGDWSEIALETVRQLPAQASSEDIHTTMLNVCYGKEDIKYSRIAARLEIASLRKNMERKLGVLPNKDSFKVIRDALLDSGVWCSKTIPPYSINQEILYDNLKTVKMESWQVAQWGDKYLLKLVGVPVETPAIAAIGIALGIHGDTEWAYELADNIVNSRVNLPTPILNGIRNGDFNGISCCVIEGDDSVESIAVADHLAMRMTAKKAGIGIRYNTRTKGSSVKGGVVEHLGKHPIYKGLHSSVSMFTQITRGGSATVAFDVIDPEVSKILLWKSQRSDIDTRIDKIDYSMAFNDAFIDSVVNRLPWYLWDYQDAPEVYKSFFTDSVEDYYKVVDEHISKGVKYVKMDALELIKEFLIIRNETGRMYCFNVSRANEHTPFDDTIRLSNLCQEISLPTKPYLDMNDLYDNFDKGKGEGETAFCTLAALVPVNISEEDYYKVALNTVYTLNRLIELTPKMTFNHGVSMLKRMSLGIGVSGLSEYLYSHGKDFTEDNLEFVHDFMEKHTFNLYKASVELAENNYYPHVEGVDYSWLPVDTKRSKFESKQDWESLRGRNRSNSVLVCIQPCESSSLASGTTNSVYPPRDKVVSKRSRKGVVQFICDDFVEGKHLKAWDVDAILLSKFYGVIQDWVDQGISADSYFDPERWSDGKKPMSALIREWVAHFRLGNKSMYYVNTRDVTSTNLADILSQDFDESEEGCESCTL